VSQNPVVAEGEVEEKYERRGSGLRRTGWGANSPMTYVEVLRVSS
jgi:hypothetical protein